MALVRTFGPPKANRLNAAPDAKGARLQSTVQITDPTEYAIKLREARFRMVRNDAPNSQ